MAKLVNITAPTFTINGETYNEYEIRAILVQIAKGMIPAGIVITDVIGNSVTVNSRGVTSGVLWGMSICDDLVMNLINERVKY
jgi:hypothetical protein